MKYLIKSITKNYAGKVGGVIFIDGKAETEDSRLAGWFKNSGYLVKEAPGKVAAKETETPKEEKPGGDNLDTAGDLNKKGKETLEEEEIKNLTNEELKKLLDEKEIEYKTNAVKTELIELLTEA